MDPEKPQSTPNRFVVLRHDSPAGVHFDFMLDVGDALKTWSLSQPPQPGLEIAATPLADHRRAYLDYEGPVSNDRGSVIRCDAGAYITIRQTDSEWVLDISGENYRGRLTIQLNGSNNTVFYC